MKKTLLLALAVLCSQARADIVLRDDTRTEVRLAAPAKRIVSLAPNITEVVYAAGAGGKLVGTVDFSDYPAAE
jgi:iron complex transport system substrate-binding protein